MGFQPVIAADGSGGAIITWFDSRVSPTELDIFAQRILNDGTVAPGWPVNGRAVCTASSGQNFPAIASDGAHGAVIAWSDIRNLTDVRIFAQHVLGSGVVDPAWPLDGRDVSGTVAIESRALAVTDGAGGAVVAWERFTGQTTIGHIFAQHVQAGGVVDPAWPAGGRALSQDQSDQTHAEIAPDGTGGVIVVWDENNQHLFAQHVLADGTLDALYPANGRPMCNLPNRQTDAAIVGDGVGGAIVSWTDDRDDTNTDIFALQVLEAGADAPTGVRTPAAGAVVVNVLPNPFSGSTHISFTAPDQGMANIGIFDVTGRSVKSFTVPAGGDNNVQWDGRTSGGEAAASGVYFCRVTTPAGQAVRRLVLVR